MYVTSAYDGVGNDALASLPSDAHRLQYTMNRAAVPLQLKQICVDGDIGQITVSAVRATIQAVNDKYPYIVSMMNVGGYALNRDKLKTKKDVLDNLPNVLQSMNAAANLLGAPLTVDEPAECAGKGKGKGKGKSKGGDVPGEPPKDKPLISFSDPLVLATIGVVGLLLLRK